MKKNAMLLIKKSFFVSFFVMIMLLSCCSIKNDIYELIFNSGSYSSDFVFSVVASAAVKEEGDFGENNALHWRVTDDGIMYVSGTGNIPDYIGYYESTKSPLERNDIYKVIVEPGITGIGDYAFYYCYNLEEVSLPSSLQYIGDGAFQYCYKLKRIEVPEGVCKIGSDAFASSGIEQVIIPSSVTKIAENAFSFCGNVVSYSVASDNADYATDSTGALFSLEQGKKYKLLFFPVANSVTEYTIPDEVKQLGERAFGSCRNLKKITIGNGVEKIDDYSFSSSEVLEEISFGSSLQCIGENAFSWCSALKSVRIPDTVITIGKYAFNNCPNLTDVTLSKSLQKIEEYLFSDCGLEEIVIPDSVQIIKKCAFLECESLTKIKFGKKLTQIDDNAMKGCTSLSNIVLSSENTSFCVIDNVLFNNDVTAIVCYPATKSEVIYSIPSTVKEIRKNAFYGCDNLYSIGVPASVKKIEESAFSKCKVLKEVYYECTQSEIKKISIAADNNSLSDAKAYYSMALPEADTIRISGMCGEKISYSLTYEGTLTLKGSGSTYDYEESYENPTPFYDIRQAINKIIIEDRIAHLGTYLFSHCYKAKTILLPKQLTVIGSGCFYDCEAVTAFDFPEDIVSIGDNAFAGCYSLKEVFLPDSITEMGMSAFSWDNELEFVKLPANLKIIESCTFNDCEKLKKVIFPKKLELIKNSAFSSTALISVEIPEGCKYLDGMAFYSCSYLQEVTIPASVIRIGGGSASYASTFGSCGSLKKFTVAKNNPVYCSVDGSLFSKDKKTLIQYAGSREGTYVIPEGTEYLDMESVSNTQFSEIILPKSLITIGNSALSYNKALTHLIIPDNVTSIKEYAFSGNTVLESIQLSKNLEQIEESTFYNCHTLKKITIPPKVKYIGNNAFLFCKSLEEIIISNPNCMICDSVDAISREVQIASAVGSAAEAHAKRYGMAFRDIVTDKVFDYRISADNLIKYLPTNLKVDINTSSLSKTDKKAYNELKELADSIVKNCKTQEEMIQKILDWTTSALTYRYFTLPPSGIQEMYNFLLGYNEGPRYANCMGYTAVFNFLTELVGFPTANVYVNGDHMISAVLIDKKWTLVEPQGSFDISFDSSAAIDHIDFTDNGLSMSLSCCFGVTYVGNITGTSVITLPDYVAEIRNFEDCSNTFKGKVNTIFSEYAEKTFCSYSESGGYFLAKNHNWEYQSDKSTDGTCCSPKECVYSCSECKKQRTELYVDNDAHKWGNKTVINSASIGYMTCTECRLKEYEEITTYMLCDVNFDSNITAADARLALRKSVGLENYEYGSLAFFACDADCDGKVSAADARLILRISVGLE